MATTPGTTSTSSPGEMDPLHAISPATSSGPANAPIWSSALCTPSPRPMPTPAAASASRADFAGLRTALPSRSARISTVATVSPAPPSRGATASSGTQTAVSA